MEQTPGDVPILPTSNADIVAGNLVANSADLTGARLVALIRLLVSRAEQIKTILDQSASFDQELWTTIGSGKKPDQMQANAALLDAFYEPLCLKWFLSRAMRRLGEHLEYEVYQAQRNLRAVREIVFTEDGDVGSYRLDAP